MLKLFSPLAGYGVPQVGGKSRRQNLSQNRKNLINPNISLIYRDLYLGIFLSFGRTSTITFVRRFAFSLIFRNGYSQQDYLKLHRGSCELPSGKINNLR
jgi:hypothetical protein